MKACIACVRYSLFVLLVSLTFAALISAPALAAPPAPGTRLAEDYFGAVILYPNDPAESQPMLDAGARWTRPSVFWSSVEATQGVYNWSGEDSYLQGIINQGYKIVLTARDNPAWAASTACGPIYPDKRAAFANFMKLVVQRYSASPYNIRYFELGNEPDNADPVNYAWIGGCWGKGHPNSLPDAGGANYAEMLKVVYPKMKEGNPNALVLIGGLADDSWISEGGPFDQYFYDDVLAAGGGAYFDVINFHYYDAFSYKWGSMLGKVNDLQTKTVNATGAPKLLTVTETGLPSAKPPDSGDPTVYSEELQARYVFRGYAHSLYADVYPAIWFWVLDRPNESGGYYYGLLRTDYSQKPAYTAYKTIHNELVGLYYAEKPGGLASYLEGYTMGNSSVRKTVIWRTRDGASNQAFPLDSSGASLRTVDKAGVVSLIADGSAQDLDAAVNASVTISLGPSPIIVEPGLCNTPASISDLKIKKLNATDVSLNWADTPASVLYQIWRANTPYANPNPATATPFATAAAPPWTDVGSIGANPVNYFYKASFKNTCKKYSGLSNETATFHFSLLKGG